MARLVDAQTRAILWAQWRSMRNFHGGKIRVNFSVVITAIWYLLWIALSVPIAMICAEPGLRRSLGQLLTYGLVLAFFYWQLIPIFMASSGVSLDFRKLVVYPIPRRDLFQIEVLLRLTAAVEMVIVLIGAAVGLLLNPALPFWAPLALAPFVALNLFLSAGLRDLLSRLFARRRVKEIVALGIVLMAAAPQAIVQSGWGEKIRDYLRTPEQLYWPWAATASLATASQIPASIAVLIAWTLIAYGFARWQFERSFKFDAAAAASRSSRKENWSISGYFFQFPSLLLPDPVGVLVEKELRSLARSPRFRLVFLMGFSFGPIIWLPMMLGAGGMAGRTGYWSHYLTLLSVYAVLLLGEVCIFNVLGFDRAAVQVYYAMPVHFRAVMVAKNIAAIIWVSLEVILICLVGILVRMPVTPILVAESFAVTIVFLTLLMSAGNLLSLRNPRPVDPDQSWHRSTTGRSQALLLALYPAISAPIVLAYLARYAFESEAAFYAVLALDTAIAGIVYWIALDSALASADSRKEEIVATLTRHAGPMAT